MQIVASIYAATNHTNNVSAYTDRTQAGSHIGYVVVEQDLFYFLSDDKEVRYGAGECVSPALKMATRALIAARRHFGRDVVVC